MDLQVTKITLRQFITEGAIVLQNLLVVRPIMARRPSKWLWRRDKGQVKAEDLGPSQQRREQRRRKNKLQRRSRAGLRDVHENSWSCRRSFWPRCHGGMDLWLVETSIPKHANGVPAPHQQLSSKR